MKHSEMLDLVETLIDTCSATQLKMAFELLREASLKRHEGEGVCKK